MPGSITQEQKLQASELALKNQISYVAVDGSVHGENSVPRENLNIGYASIVPHVNPSGQNTVSSLCIVLVAFYQ